MRMPVAGGALGKDLSQERAVVLPSTSGGESKKAGKEAACALLRVWWGGWGLLCGDSLLRQSEDSFYICAIALANP